MVALDLPHLNWMLGSGIPHELIEVCAYFKWVKRCRKADAEVHGFHEQDWHEAERELSEIWSNLTVLDMFKFAERVDRCNLDLCQSAIEERAYFLSQKKPFGDPTAIWHEARVQEWNVQFANVFFSFRRPFGSQFSVYDPGEDANDQCFVTA